VLYGVNICLVLVTNGPLDLGSYSAVQRQDTVTPARQVGDFLCKSVITPMGRGKNL